MRADLVAFVKSFSPRFKTEQPGVPIAVPAEPALNLDGLKHGKELFTKLECFKAMVRKVVAMAPRQLP